LTHPATVVEHDGRRWLVAPYGPVLKRYVAIATATRSYFQADKDAPVEDFVAEADRHPVFEFTPVTRDRPDDQR
jgi:hypothetical protein